MRVTCFSGEVSNTEREILLKGALKDVVDHGAIQFIYRGGRIQIDWAEMQRRTHELAEKESESYTHSRF